MIISENKMKKMEVHPNVVIRKKMKSKAKLGKMLLEIYDEQKAGVYPTMDHMKRLKKFGLHPYTWDEAFGQMTEKKGKKVFVEFNGEIEQAIMVISTVVGLYKTMDQQTKNVMEAVTISLLRE